MQAASSLFDGDSIREAGASMYQQIESMYPICRSITGEGVRQTLSLLEDMLPLERHEVPTGTKVFDWTVPKEWSVRSAWIKNSQGDVIVDFADHNLHLLNYSTPIHQTMSLEALGPHLFSLPDQPDLIPYKTSYYAENWGFCLPHRQRQALPEDDYEVFIDSSLADGNLSYGELLIPGESETEILFVAHICHPSLANDNLSGISVIAHLAAALQQRKNRYSYRFLWIPATIGTITWLARNSTQIHKIKCGLVAALLGDRGDFTYKKTRRGATELDLLVPYALESCGLPVKTIEFSPYGYDERQFCSPGFDLEVGSLTRSVFGSFPEYHTSADNLDFVQPDNLAGSLEVYAKVIELLESSQYYQSLSPYGEPQLGKRGLYAAIGGLRNDIDHTVAMLWILNSADSHQSLYTISQKSGIPYADLVEVAQTLLEHDLIQPVAWANPTQTVCE